MDEASAEGTECVVDLHTMHTMASTEGTEERSI